METTLMVDEYRPKSRLSELLVERVADDLLVLDQKNSLGHCLNRMAAAVLERCDGTRSEEDIRQDIEREIGSPVARVIVTYALQELGLKHLVETEASESKPGLDPSPASPPAVRNRIRRRDLMKQMGVAALIVPAVTTVLVPTPAMAASAVAAAPAPAPAAPIIGIPGAPAGAVLVATP